MSFSCCFFDPLFSDDFKSNSVDLLDLRIPMELQVGLLGGLSGDKLVQSYSF